MTHIIKFIIIIAAFGFTFLLLTGAVYCVLRVLGAIDRAWKRRAYRHKVKRNAERDYWKTATAIANVDRDTTIKVPPYIYRPNTMIINEQQREEMLNAAKSLIEWMNANCHPHCTARVDQNTVELTEGIATNKTNEFLVD